MFRYSRQYYQVEKMFVGGMEWYAHRSIEFKAKPVLCAKKTYGKRCEICEEYVLQEELRERYNCMSY